MKILILLKKWPGGVGVVVKNIKKELEKRGHEIKIISREDDLKIYSLKDSIFPIRKIVKDLMKKGNYDIVYTQDWSLAFPLLFPFPIFKEKHFCCFHGNEIGKSKIFQDIVGKLMGNHLVVVGDSLKERFPKSNLVYNGVDLSFFKPLNKKRNYLGWINKGTEQLNKTDIIKISREVGLDPLITEKFKLPFEKMNEFFYNRCKIFLSIPPKTAGFNLCWIEAMASGVPIIIGNNNGIGEKLPITKVEGFGWDESSSKEEKIKIIKKAVENAKPKEYRNWLIKHKGFTWKYHVNKLLKLFNKEYE